MNNKKAFTLVELMAVIALIAIILTITISSISAVIGRNKKNIFTHSVEGIVKVIDTYSSNLYEDQMTDGYYVFTYSSNKLMFGTEEIKTSNSLESAEGEFKLDINSNVNAHVYLENKYCLVITKNKYEYKDINDIASRDDCYSK